MGSNLSLANFYRRFPADTNPWFEEIYPLQVRFFTWRTILQLGPKCFYVRFGHTYHPILCNFISGDMSMSQLSGPHRLGPVLIKTDSYGARHRSHPGPVFRHRWHTQ